MGWDITRGATKASIVRELTTRTSADHVPMEHRVVGSTLFVRILRPETEENFIAVYLLRSDRGYGYGYKGMDEAMHPYYYDCPLALLEKPPVYRDAKLTEAAEKWRRRVRAWHALKKALTPGLVLHPHHYPVWGNDGDPEPAENFETVTVTSTKPLVGRFVRRNGEAGTYRINPYVLGASLEAFAATLSGAPANDLQPALAL